MGRPSGAPEVPSSLVPGATAADRRVLAGVIAANGAPVDAASGVATGFARFLTFAILLSAGSITFRVWYFHRASQRWCVDTRPASTTAGVVAFAATDPNPQLSAAEVIGWERVYFEVVSVAGGAATDVWIEGVTF